MASADDELVRVRLTQLATGQSLHCAESRESALVRCAIAEGAFTSAGAYEIVLETPVRVGAKWGARFTLPPDVLSFSLVGAVTIGPVLPGVTLVRAQVAVAPQSMAQLAVNGTPKPGDSVDFTFANRSSDVLLLEQAAEGAVGQLFRLDPSGERVRFVGPLDECFEPKHRYTVKARRGERIFMSPQSTSIPLTSGRYVFVARYRKANSKPIFERGDYPTASAEVAFEVP